MSVESRSLWEGKPKNCSRIKTNVSPIHEPVYLYIDYYNFTASVAVVGSGVFANEVAVNFFGTTVSNNECSVVKLSSTVGRLSVSVDKTEYFDQEVVVFEKSLLMTFSEHDCASYAYERCTLNRPKQKRLLENSVKVTVPGLCTISTAYTSDIDTTHSGTTRETPNTRVTEGPQTTGSTDRLVTGETPPLTPTDLPASPSPTTTGPHTPPYAETSEQPYTQPTPPLTPTDLPASPSPTTTSPQTPPNTGTSEQPYTQPTPSLTPSDLPETSTPSVQTGGPTQHPVSPQTANTEVPTSSSPPSIGTPSTNTTTRSTPPTSVGTTTIKSTETTPTNEVTTDESTSESKETTILVTANPTSRTTRSSSTSTTSPATTTDPYIVIPPPPPEEVENCNSTVITSSLCQLVNGTKNETIIQQAVNDTKTTFVNNNNVTSDDVYYAGAVIYTATQNAVTIDSEIPLKISLCNDRTKKGLISITPAKFYIVGNSTLESKDDVDFNTSTENDNSILTIENLEDCNSQPVLNSEHITGVAGVNGDANIESFPVKIVAHYKKNANNLHRIPKVGYYAGQNFKQGPTMTRHNGYYEAEHQASTLVVYYEGSSSEPILCNNFLKVAVAIITGASSIFFIFSIVAYISRNRKAPPPCCVSWFSAFFYNFHDERLSPKVQWFTILYNFAFFVFLIIVSILGNTTLITSQKACGFFAAINHCMFLVCVMLSIMKVFVVTEAVGNWKSWYSRVIWVFTGNKDSTVWPLLHVILWPIFITGGFGLTMKEFFQRNDGFCWIRPDYEFAALWLPLILLSLSFPLYIPLLGQCYPKTFIFRKINEYFVQNLNELRTQKEWKQEFRRLREIDPHAEMKIPYSPSRLCTRLLVPQVLLGLPVIFESATLYVTYLSKWHILYVIFLVCHLFFFFIICFSAYIIPKKVKKEDDLDYQYNDEHGYYEDGQESVRSSVRTDRSDREVTHPHH